MDTLTPLGDELLTQVSRQTSKLWDQEEREKGGCLGAPKNQSSCSLRNPELLGPWGEGMLGCWRDTHVATLISK